MLSSYSQAYSGLLYQWSLLPQYSSVNVFIILDGIVIIIILVVTLIDTKSGTNRKVAARAVHPIKATATAVPPTIPSKDHTHCFVYCYISSHVCLYLFDKLLPMFSGSESRSSGKTRVGINGTAFIHICSLLVQFCYFSLNLSSNK